MSNQPDKTANPALKLITGLDKQVSTRMEWEVASGGKIVRHQSGSVNASADLRRPKWFAVTKSGKFSSIPKQVRLHEVSIAKWLATLPQD